MRFRELGHTGMKISQLSFGASSLGSVFRDVPEDEAIATVYKAIDLGINFIDCSPFYGITKAETVLGKALKELPRDAYYLATKVGRYHDREFDFSAERVTKSIEESMERMNVDYIDLIQTHDIEFVHLDQILHETLPALVAAKEAGKVGHIGITGLPLHVFDYILDRADEGIVESVLSYCRYSLNDHSLAAKFDKYQAMGVGIINASPTSMGLLTERGAPDWHPAPKEVIEACAEVVQLIQSKGQDIVELAVQFACHPEAITSTLVGTANPKNIEKNVKFLETDMDQESLAEALTILKPVLNQTWASGLPENQDPGVVVTG